MKKLGLLSLLLASGVSAASYTCPEDNTMLTMTGATRVATSGALLWEYRCLQGHTYWIKR